MAKNYTRKLIFVFVFVVLMTVSLFPLHTSAQTVDVWDGQTVATGFETGAGKKSNPYVIASAAQLVYFAQAINAGALNTGDYYILTCDIDLGGHDWVPIGLVNQLTFSGTLDGCGHTISNFKINSSLESSRIGFFGIVNSPTTVIKNLTLANAQVQVSGAKSYVGALVGYLQGGAIVSGCRIAGDVTVTGLEGSTGGIAGRVVTSAKIEYSVNEATVSAAGPSNLFVGGIAGVVGSEGYVVNCVNKGNVTGERDSGESNAIYIGGITGCFGASSAGGIVENCYNTGAISSTVAAGGIVGFTNTEGNKMKNCYNLSSSVTGDSKYAGSIIGYIKNPLEIVSCMSVAVTGLSTHGSNVSNAQTGLSALETKGASEITALTNAIDAAIQANAEKEAQIIYNPTDEETTAAEETTEAPTTTSPTTTKAPSSTSQNTTSASTTGENPDDATDTNSWLIIVIVLVVLAVAAGIIFFIFKRKKK